ncbi:MAG TPA: L,D-transpeptidase [Verrucomicrobiales bacterium]|jgi:lipoprotein-anchoring transpeptidase ErfK/SrfK|nr:L,D-transpeptidase [Verrucomicrobiales bacterium]
MKQFRILAAAVLGALASCKSVPSAAKNDKLPSGSVPDGVKAEDVAAVEAHKAKGNKGGFLPSKDTLKGPLTAQNARFVVDLDAQRAYLYQHDNLIAYSPIASGRKYYRTETGNYTIGQKDLNHRSSSYGSFVNSKGGTMMSDVQAGFDPTPVGGRFEGALMKYFLRLYHNGQPTAMGLHRGVLPGYPASHGCIRLPGNMAEWFFSNVQLGTPVAVRGTKNGIPIGKSQGRPSRAPRVHSSLKNKPMEEKVPPAPESDIKTPSVPPAPEATPKPAPSGDPTPAPPAPETPPASGSN